MEEILGIFGINVKLLIIQGVNFAILLGILWYFLYRPVLKMLEERRTKIETGVENAEKAEQKLTQISDEREGIIREATQKAGVLFEQATQRGEEKTDEIVKTAHVKSEEIIKDAKARAEESKRQALLESKSEIAKMAVLSAEKILKEKVKST